MKLKHDRRIVISVGKSRKDMNWLPQTMTVSELYARFDNPVRGVETLVNYLKLKKSQQDDLKDVGGFVGGSLSGGRRKASAVTGRDLITLDFDTIPAYGTPAILSTLDGLGCSYLVYSTRKHCETAPRLRILMPLDRTVTAEEYEAIARRIASMIGIQMADPTTFEPSRLMYWPSCCADSEYICKHKDAQFVSADYVLGTYTDWHDWNEWPQVPGAISYQKLAVRQGDPETKPGVVGAFNRTYDIYRAMTDLLPGIYDQCDNDPSRYTYLGGSTTGGAVIYDNGKFLFSHHATDPCSGKLVNAFDLVRLHKFGDMDDEAAPGTPNNRLPSFTAMCQYAVADADVSALMARERREAAIADFRDIIAESETNCSEEADLDSKLQRNPQTGAALSTINNVMLILDNDPMLKGRFALNEFAGRGEVLSALPWNGKDKRRLWNDTDNNGLYWYMEKVYNISKRANIDAALDLHAATHSFNEVQNYLGGLSWDGKPRLDSLFIDYLGAEDNEYNRAVCRKAFTAAVARAMQPGVKYDNMLIRCGPQGIGKSTILAKMSLGWFNDSIRSFEGKEASELLQGVWLVEVAELDAFRKTDVSRIKQFLSLTADRYRAAYGRHVKELPRCCVFFGTSNQMDFLQDTTGNRRFWPVDVGIRSPELSAFKDMDGPIIDQIWAEAKAHWLMGEPLFLSGRLEQIARQRQEDHRDASAQEGAIQDFVQRKVPADWSKWSIDRRRDFWAGGVQGSVQLVNRDRISAIEVWCELFNKPLNDCKRSDAREINSILANIPGWKRRKMRVGASYGAVQAYVREE